MLSLRRKKYMAFSYNKGPFKATIRLPHVSGGSERVQFNMMWHIQSIVGKKINALNRRSTIIKYAIIGVSAGAALLSSYALNKYFNN
jgi:hypothetical protein